MMWSVGLFVRLFWRPFSLSLLLCSFSCCASLRCSMLQSIAATDDSPGVCWQLKQSDEPFHPFERWEFEPEIAPPALQTCSTSALPS